MKIYSGKHLENELKKKKKKHFHSGEQTGLKCTASIKECLKAVIVLEKKPEETEEEREKEEEEEEEKGGDVRIRITFMGL